MSSINVSEFREKLLVWYRANKRVLPWRYSQGQKTDPYRVWVSEVMLQQTVVKAVIPYFEKFTVTWPTIKDLARAPSQEIMDAWAGLGYYSRARNLHKCAQQVVRDHNSIFPDNEKDLLSLAGIGDYTTAAIMSIAYNKPANIVDGNVERVMARLFLLDKPLKESKKKIRQLAEQFIGSYEGHHSDYSQSLMELGATICIPSSPRCNACPVVAFCKSYQGGKQLEIPVKLPKKAKPKRYGYVYIIQNNIGELLVERRGDRGLLANTVGLPTSDWSTNSKNLKHLSCYSEGAFVTVPKVIKHVFTHFELTLFVYQSSRGLDTLNSNQYYFVNQGDVKRKLPTVFKKVYNLIDDE